MDFNQALDLINTKAPNTPIREAIVLARAIADRTTTTNNSSRPEMIEYISGRYGPVTLGVNTQLKIQAIKDIRDQFKVDLRTARDAVNWYVAHPDPMFW